LYTLMPYCSPAAASTSSRPASIRAVAAEAAGAAVADYREPDLGQNERSNETN